MLAHTDTAPGTPPRVAILSLLFLVLYGALAIVDTILMTHYARKQLAPDAPGEDKAPELEFIY